MKILTIGWGNGQGSILRLLHEYMNRNIGDISLSSIFSMSDDGRTTWVLMKEFYKSFWVDLPPPGDIRKWLYSLSNSSKKQELMDLFETIFEIDWNIADYSISDMLSLLLGNQGSDIGKIFMNLNRDYILDIKSPIAWHKFGNILMAALFAKYDFDFLKMRDTMWKICDIWWKIIPITTSRALIQAELSDGTVIKTQDHISNIADYTWVIQNISLMECSQKAIINSEIYNEVEWADLIIITPWDLFTSILSNFLFQELSAAMRTSWKKVVFMLNGNNKRGETTGYSICDFIDVFYKHTNIIPDYLLGNNTLPDLTAEEKERFKNDISVKWWDYLILDDENKGVILCKYPNIEFISWNYIEKENLYKLNAQAIDDLLSVLKK